MTRRTTSITTRRRAAVLASALAAAFAAAPAAADTEPISATPLTERLAFAAPVSMTITQELDGLEPQVVEIEDASRIVTVEFTIQPGAVFPWHTHPGTVLIGIAQGDFVFIIGEDCTEREFAAGDALVDPGDTVHTAYNPGETETVVIATLLAAPAEGALTIPVAADEAAALDERCGIETPGEHAH